MDRYLAVMQKGEEEPWHYGENTLTSLVVAAVSHSPDSVALMDYRAVGVGEDGEDTHRRPDLFAIVGGKTFRLEAKFRWVTSWGQGIETAFETKLPTTIEEALEQVRPMQEEADWIGVLLFVIPYVPPRHRVDADSVIARMRECSLPGLNSGVRMDHYPEAGRDDRDDGDNLIPGLTTFVVFRRP